MTFADPKVLFQKLFQLLVHVEPLDNVQPETNNCCAGGKQTNSVNVTQQLVHESAKHAVTDDKQVAQEAVVGQSGDELPHSMCDDLKIVHQNNVSLLQAPGIKRVPNTLLYPGQWPSVFRG